jgi:hypothetical protein
VSDREISKRAHALLSRLTSVAEIEALLLLQARGGDWSGEALAREARIAPSAAGTMLRNLATLGILAEAGAVYRYAPASPEIARAVDDLARAYRERPFAVVTLVHSRALEDVRTLSDAFLLRKKEEE